MLRESFAPLREAFDLREWGADARPSAGDTIALEPQDLKLLTLREAIRLSSELPFVRWIIAGSLKDAGVGRIPPGSHGVLPTTGVIDAEAFAALRLKLSGIGPQHMGIDWRAGGLSERALDRLFAQPDGGPSLTEVALAIRSATSVISRAVVRATGVGYDDVRMRRAMAMMLACRALSGRSWQECGDSVALNPRTARRTLREEGIDFEGAPEALLAGAAKVLVAKPPESGGGLTMPAAPTG